jgi:hypothetical protein
MPSPYATWKYASSWLAVIAVSVSVDDQAPLPEAIEESQDETLAGSTGSCAPGWTAHPT